MGMGYGSNFAEVITDKALSKIVPDEIKKFQDFLDKHETTLDSFGMTIDREIDMMDDANEEGKKEIKSAWESLVKVFNESTKLELNIGYHSCDDEGDRYDEVDGAYFYVSGMYQLSPEGKELQEKLGGELAVERRFFVTFG